MTHWTVPDQDTLRRIIFQLQRSGWGIHSPADGASPDGRWHATDGTTDLAGDTLGALLDHLEWFYAR